MASVVAVSHSTEEMVEKRSLQSIWNLQKHVKWISHKLEQEAIDSEF